jgi:Xaa-Pro aminopeptidase
VCLVFVVGAALQYCADAGGEGVKLEQQVVITETGHDLLTPYSLDLV